MKAPGLAPEKAGYVPVVSVFFGIVVSMFTREHGVPHFHAIYQGERASFTFDGRIAGTIKSRTARRLIAEWALAHQPELTANWERIKSGLAPERIDPLE